MGKMKQTLPQKLLSKTLFIFQSIFSAFWESWKVSFFSNLISEPWIPEQPISSPIRSSEQPRELLPLVDPAEAAIQSSNISFQLLSISINKLSQHRELLILLNPVEKLSLVFSHWPLIWLIQLVQVDLEVFARLIDRISLLRAQESDWESLIQIILDLRKLNLDQTEIGLIEAMILGNGGKNTFICFLWFG